SAVGLEFTSRRELSKTVNETKLLYGELRPGEEFHFAATVVGILQTQAQVFSSLACAFPDTRDPIWLEQRVPRFRDMVERLRRRLFTAFPEHAARIRMRGILGQPGEP